MVLSCSFSFVIRDRGDRRNGGGTLTSFRFRVWSTVQGVRGYEDHEHKSS